MRILHLTPWLRLGVCWRKTTLTSLNNADFYSTLIILEAYFELVYMDNYVWAAAI